MKKLITSGLFLATLTLSGIASAHVARVSNGNDSGPGSLRSALSQNPRIISIDDSVTTIRVTETLEYNGTTSLGIIGSGQTIDGSGLFENADILSINQGATVRIDNISFIGNLDEVNEDPSNPIGGTAIFVNVPETRVGTVRLTLENINVTRVGNHGIHISDCAVRDECVEGDGSPASVSAILNNVHVNSVGLGRQDGDGVRLDERGEGNIIFVANDSTFINVGADGVELDEADNGYIRAKVNNSTFDSNGRFCDLASEIIGGPCDNDGDPDLDDGFDIDEAGDGSIFVAIKDSKFINNYDEGLDFDEEGGGDIELSVTNSFALGNEDQGIRASEDDDGDVRILFSNVTFGDNNQEDEAVRIEENNDGDVLVKVFDSNVIDGDNEGLRIDEDNSGSGTLKVRNSNFTVFDLDDVDQI